MKIRTVRAELLQADKQTNGQRERERERRTKTQADIIKLIIRFWYFCESA